VNHLGLAQLTAAEPFQRLQQLRRRGPVVVGGLGVIEGPPLPWDPCGVAACHQSRAAASACGSVNAPAYSALPTIAPSTPSGTSSRRSTRSCRLDTPPDAITGLS